MSTKIGIALALLIAAAPFGGPANSQEAEETSALELRALEIWRHREHIEGALVLISGEYGCREHADRRHVLIPNGGRWILELWEAPREGYSRLKLLDDISGWSLQIEDREPPWLGFEGPDAFGRSRFWERLERGEHPVHRILHVSHLPKLEHEYQMIEGEPIGADGANVQVALKEARAAVPAELVARLGTLFDLVAGAAASSSGFGQYEQLFDLVAHLVPGISEDQWSLADTRLLKAGSADDITTTDILRGFRLSEVDDPLAGLHVSRGTCSQGDGGSRDSSR